MRNQLFLCCLLYSMTLAGQATGNWQEIILPAGAPNQIARMCDEWICRTATGYYRSTDDGQSWMAVATQNLPENGRGLQWRTNKKGVILTQTTVLSQDPVCKYWTDEFWVYNCTTHLFEKKFSSNSHDCFHSGGYGGALSSINDNSDWFYKFGYFWLYGGPPPPCEFAYRSADGGQNWSSTGCDYPATQHTDSIFYTQSDTIWFNPPGTAQRQIYAPLPQALIGLYGIQVAYCRGTVAILYEHAGLFEIYFSTDAGASWQAQEVSIATPTINYGSSTLSVKSDHFFVQNNWYCYVAPYTNPGAMLPVHPEGVSPDGLLWVYSNKWWIWTRQNHYYVSNDTGQTWQEMSLSGLGPARNAGLLFDGQHP